MCCLPDKTGYQAIRNFFNHRNMMAEITNTISNFLYRTYDFIPRPKSIYYTFLTPSPPRRLPRDYFLH